MINLHSQLQTPTPIHMTQTSPRSCISSNSPQSNTWLFLSALFLDIQDFTTLNKVSKSVWTALRQPQPEIFNLFISRLGIEKKIEKKSIHNFCMFYKEFREKLKQSYAMKIISLFGNVDLILHLPIRVIPKTAFVITSDDIDPSHEYSSKSIKQEKMIRDPSFAGFPEIVRLKSDDKDLDETIIVKYTQFLPKQITGDTEDSVWQDYFAFDTEDRDSEEFIHQFLTENDAKFCSTKKTFRNQHSNKTFSYQGYGDSVLIKEMQELIKNGRIKFTRKHFMSKQRQYQIILGHVSIKSFDCEIKENYTNSVIPSPCG